MTLVLQIVRRLVVSELGGALRIEPRTDGPARVRRSTFRYTADPTLRGPPLPLFW